MKYFILLLISFALLSCRYNNPKGENNNIDFIYPIEIESGARGKGSNSSKTVVKIDKDSVHIVKRDKEKNERWLYSIDISSTDFAFRLSQFSKDDFFGYKNYSYPFARDGGYTRITSPYGVRNFVNVFTNESYRTDIRPDTIGLYKYASVYREVVKWVKASKQPK